MIGWIEHQRHLWSADETKLFIATFSKANNSRPLGHVLKEAIWLALSPNIAQIDLRTLSVTIAKGEINFQIILVIIALDWLWYTLIFYRFGLTPMRSTRLPTPTLEPTSGSWSRMVLSSRSLLLFTPDPGLEQTRRQEGKVVTVALARGRVQQMPEHVRRTCGCREWEFSGGFLRDTGHFKF